MKKFSVTAIVLLSFNVCFAQFGLDEIRIFNKSDENIRVYFYPVSMNFNADTTSEDFGFNGLYSVVSATRPTPNSSVRWDYNNGLSYYTSNNSLNFYFDLNPNENVGFNIDKPRTPGVGTSFGSFGSGVYKVEIRYLNVPSPYSSKIDSALVEYDNFEIAPGDLGIYIDSFHVSRRFTYKFCCEGTSTHNIDTLPGHKINIWESENDTRRKDYGNYVLKDASSPIYNQHSIIPQDSRIFAGIYSPYITVDQNHVFPRPIFIENVGDVFLYDDRQGNLTLNLTIQKSVNSPSSVFTTTFPGIAETYVANPSNIVIFDSVFLAIDKGSSSPVILTLDKFTSPSGINDGTDIIVKNAAKLILKHSDSPPSDLMFKIASLTKVY